MSLTDITAEAAARLAANVSRQLATLPTAARNEALTSLHDTLLRKKDEILAANRLDVDVAVQAVQNGELSQSALKRLDLRRPGKYSEMLRGILNVRELEDPVGQVTLRTLLDDGLVLERVTCPIGVLLIIFEARPEVIANIAALAIKSANAAILKGGKESTHSFVAISNAISEALSTSQIPLAAIQLVKTRDAVLPLLAQDRYIDLVIPRGSNDLVRYVKNSTRIPVLGHADGLCSIYIHGDADPDMAVRVILDAKTGYPAACNAVETLVVDRAALSTILPTVCQSLVAKGVTLRCDAASKTALQEKLSADISNKLQAATEADYSTEFLDLILAIKTVPSSSSELALDAAIAHINKHSSKHTDAILTSSSDVADKFLRGIDSAGVFWNTSTRLADGMRYGFGTEVGISTNKIHSRGPVGLEGLTIYKYLIKGEGNIAGEYFEGPGGKKWKHQKLSVDDL